MCQSDPEGDLPARRKRTTSFLELLLAQYETYHNHKENMAHAGFLLQLGALVAAITANEIPPPWMNSLLCPKMLTTAALVATWFMTNLFIRWQLRNRRFAALLFAAILATLRDWAVNEPSDEELQPEKSNKPSSEKPCWSNLVLSRILVLIDYLLPLPSTMLHSDVPLLKYPKGLNNRFKEQQQVGTGAIKSECFLFIAGAVLLALAIVRTWL